MEPAQRLTSAPADSQVRRCRSCRYLLTGLSAPRCPECGTEFDPDDPRTFDSDPRKARARRLAQKGEVLLVMITGGFAVLLALLSIMALHTRYQFLPVLVETCLTGMIGLGTLLLFAVARTWPSWRRSILVLLLWFLGPVTVISQWPLAVSFALHRAAMDKLADDLESGTIAQGSFSRWVGIYHIQGGTVSENGDVDLWLEGYSPNLSFGERGFVRGHAWASSSDPRAVRIADEWYVEEFW